MPEPPVHRGTREYCRHKIVSPAAAAPPGRHLLRSTALTVAVAAFPRPEVGWKIDCRCWARCHRRRPCRPSALRPFQGGPGQDSSAVDPVAETRGVSLDPGFASGRPYGAHSRGPVPVTASEPPLRLRAERSQPTAVLCPLPPGRPCPVQSVVLGEARMSDDQHPAHTIDYRCDGRATPRRDEFVARLWVPDRAEGVDHRGIRESAGLLQLRSRKWAPTWRSPT